jgi:hypothetical protein
MPDNIIIASGPSGATYNMATDYGFGTSADAHVQIVKAVYGDDTTSTRVSNTNPMPVQLFSAYSGGSTASIIEDGQLKVKGTLDIGNQIAIHGSTAGFLKVIVAGGVTGTSGGTGLIGSTGNPAVYSAVEVTGSVQGISGGQALTVSATDLDIRNLTAGVIGYTGATLSDSVAVQGIYGGTALTVSATDLDIRGLTAATDSVSIVGTAASNVGVTGTVTAIATDLDIRDLSAGTDSVAVYAASGGTTLPVQLYSGGTAVGVSGDALKVAFDSVTGVTFSVNVAADIGVSNTTGTNLAISGATLGNAVRVEGAGPAQSVIVSATDLDIRNLTSADQVTVVGAAATAATTTANTITQVDNKLATINNNVTSVNSRVDTLNTSLTTLSNSVTTVGTEKFIKTSVNQIVPPKSLYVQNITVTGSGKPLKNITLQNGITIKSSNSNSSQIYVGGTSLQTSISEGYPIDPGQEIFINIENASSIYIRTQAGRSANIHVIGS